MIQHYACMPIATLNGLALRLYDNSDAEWFTVLAYMTIVTFNDLSELRLDDNSNAQALRLNGNSDAYKLFSVTCNWYDNSNS